MMLSSRAQLTTPNADKVLYKLCKHYALKVPVEFDSHQAHVHFPIGECRIQRQDDTLDMICAADAADKLAKIEFIMDEHLGLMAKTPDLKLDWAKTE
ncbi:MULTISPECIES: DUF2218 domain-containing protein [Chromobacterium]|nr:MULTISPECIES: DUF2218 domain-containing protein [Chromobacterium]MCD5360582.1 DUF2218 domain-containing protein [Chromobacterium aquaticum]MCP1289233.1 DUF2218 domain-containing protein [Chromobacterium sp. S0633]MDH0342403.1 DUF2218 domain-containing protein [Chromobacterium haemolyticum]UGA39186.1 DUF2218 domain-containing protein [Chromobacterium haemolyticum]WON82983.1 DUF2218 domain-containing protein [Chromobacterium haemolyticum]